MTIHYHPKFRPVCGHKGCQKPRAIGKDKCPDCHTAVAMLDARNHTPKKEPRPPYKPPIPAFVEVPFRGMIS